jgi:hypothetical protein
MTTRKSSEPSPESVARANRQRLAQEEGLRAMADVARDGVAIRKNMDRLRALREAREAEQLASPPAAAPDAPVKKKRVKKAPKA